MIACFEPFPDSRLQQMRVLEEETEGLLGEILSISEVE